MGEMTLAESVEALGLEKFKRHIFLCAGLDKPKCCSEKTCLKSSKVSSIKVAC